MIKIFIDRKLKTSIKKHSFDVCNILQTTDILDKIAASSVKLNWSTIMEPNIIGK